MRFPWKRLPRIRLGRPPTYLAASTAHLSKLAKTNRLVEYFTEMTMQLLNTALLNTAALLNAIRRTGVPRWGACCVLALTLPGIILAQDRVQSSENQVATATASTTDEAKAALSNLPDSPGAAWAKAQDSTPQAATAPSTQNGASQSGSTQSGASSTTATQDQSQKPQRPVGTAAAEAPKVSGITAAQPAGVAIAPAKQHRVRTIVLRVGAIVGAGVAVGTVVALTAGTSSKPPGAH